MVALGSLAYQVWAVIRRPPFLRTLGVKIILGASLTVNLTVVGAWVFLLFRYQ